MSVGKHWPVTAFLTSQQKGGPGLLSRGDGLAGGLGCRCGPFLIAAPGAVGTSALAPPLGFSRWEGYLELWEGHR